MATAVRAVIGGVAVSLNLQLGGSGRDRSRPVS